MHGREVGKRMERYIGKEVKQAINTNHWVRTSLGSFSSSGSVAEILLSSCSRPSSLSEEVVPYESYITHTRTRHPIPMNILVFFDGLFVSGLSGPVTSYPWKMMVGRWFSLWKIVKWSLFRWHSWIFGEGTSKTILYTWDSSFHTVQL